MMGVYYTAKAMIGFKASLKKFYEETEKTSCDHNPGAVKFCPDCGKEVKTYKRVYEIAEGEVLRYEILEALPDGYVYEINEIDDDIVLFVGYGMAADEDEVKFSNIPDFETVKATIATRLKSMENLLELEKFGLWLTNVGR
jgi:hypothetical protein